MLKKVLIGVGVLILIIAIGLMYMNNRNRILSPPGEEVYQKNDFTISVNYSRPSVKGRLIFGAKTDGALQPYGTYWRLGANESTKISLNEDVLFNGEELNAGTYKVYAVPGADSFMITVNSDYDTWGAFEPDYSKDLFTTEVPVNYLTEPMEQFTVSITDASDGGALLYFTWSDVELEIPIVQR